VSGVQWGGFDLSAATTTLFELLKMVVIMAAGIALSLATSHLQMKQGLERALSMLRPVRFPVQAVSLMAALLLRFIPLLLREAARFARIAKSRGKHGKAGVAVRFRDLPAMAVP